MEDLIYPDDRGSVHHESGLFDECVSIVIEDRLFQGQYCTLFFDLKPVLPNEVIQPTNPKEEEPADNMSYFRFPSVSFCIPSTCGARDVRLAVAQLVGYRFFNGKNFSVVTISDENYCYTQEKITASKKLDAVAIVAM